MSVWLSTVVLSGSKLNRPSLGYLTIWSISTCGNDYGLKNCQKERAFFRNTSVYYCSFKLRLHLRPSTPLIQETPLHLRKWKYLPKVCVTSFIEQCMPALTRIQRKTGGAATQLCRWIRTLETLLWEPGASQVFSCHFGHNPAWSFPYLFCYALGVSCFLFPVFLLSVYLDPALTVTSTPVIDLLISDSI